MGQSQWADFQHGFHYWNCRHDGGGSNCSFYWAELSNTQSLLASRQRPIEWVGFARRTKMIIRIRPRKNLVKKRCFLNRGARKLKFEKLQISYSANFSAAEVALLRSFCISVGLPARGYSNILHGICVNFIFRFPRNYTAAERRASKLPQSKCLIVSTQLPNSSLLFATI